MAMQSATTNGTAKVRQAGFARLRERTEAIADLQRDLLLTYEEIGEEWASRLQSEAALWSTLVGRLATAQSAPDCIVAYSDCVSQRLQLAEDDSRRFMDDCQRMAQKLSGALNNGQSPVRDVAVRPTAHRTGASSKPRKRKAR